MPASKGNFLGAGLCHWKMSLKNVQLTLGKCLTYERCISTSGTKESGSYVLALSLDLKECVLLYLKLMANLAYLPATQAPQVFLGIKISELFVF